MPSILQWVTGITTSVKMFQILQVFFKWQCNFVWLPLVCEGKIGSMKICDS